MINETSGLFYLYKMGFLELDLENEAYFLNPVSWIERISFVFQVIIYKVFIR